MVDSLTYFIFDKQIECICNFIQAELITYRSLVLNFPLFCYILQVKTIFLTWLPFILRMSRPGKKITRKHLFMSSKMKELELKERSSRSLLANVLDMDDDFRGQHPNNSAPVHTVSGGGRGGGSAGDETPLYHPCLSTQRELQSILRELRFITRRMREDDENQEVISDWKFAGMVVDRICLFGFTLFTILSTCVTIFQAPHLVA